MMKMFAFVKVLLPSFNSTTGVWRKLLMALFVAGVGVGAFFWGRNVASQPPGPRVAVDPLTPYTPVADQTYTAGVVAYIAQGRVPITRQELGEYLIARLGADRIDALVNRRIIELACRDKNIFVSDAEVDAQFADDLKALGATNISREQFAMHILKPFNKTEYEWKEDIIRPRIAMNKLVRAEINITQEDIDKAYDAKYGPSVNCRMIVMRAGDAALWLKVHEQILKEPAAFDKFATDPKIQFIELLCKNHGEAPPIHKNFGDINVEKTAFGLSVGQVSVPIEMPDHTAVILKCDKQNPPKADRPAWSDQLRADLYQHVLQLRISQRVPEKLDQLRKISAPKVYLERLNSQPAPAPTQMAAANPTTLPGAPESTERVPLTPPPPAALSNTPPMTVPPAPGNVQTAPLQPVNLVAPPADYMRTVPAPQTPPSTPLPPFGPTSSPPPGTVIPFVSPGYSPAPSPPTSSQSLFPMTPGIPSPPS